MKAINACAFIIIGFFLPQNFSFSSTQGQHVVSHNRQAEKEMYVIFCPFVPFCHKLQLPPTSLHPTSTNWSQSYLLETLNLDQKTQQLFQLHNHKITSYNLRVFLRVIRQGFSLTFYSDIMIITIKYSHLSGNRTFKIHYRENIFIETIANKLYLR